MNEKEKELLDKTIDEKVINYIKKYKKNPKYLKIPLWIFVDLKQNYLRLIKIDYLSGRFTYEGLYICETITIARIEEIEVF